MKVVDSIVIQAAAMAAVRRDIHACPELGFEEVRTADLMAQKLTEWGIPVHRGMGSTGVVGIVKTAHMPARCTHAAMTVTLPCCWRRRSTWLRTATSMARCT